MISLAVRQEAAALLAALRASGLMVATAESCTGGLIAGALTEIAGSSDVVDRGFVTYSNEAKTEMLGVPVALIETHGAVSEPVARAMAEGALARSRAGVTVAVTGVAGPGGGSAEKPVGTVWFGAARRGGATVSERVVFAGDRSAVREATVQHAMELLGRGGPHEFEVRLVSTLPSPASGRGFSEGGLMLGGFLGVAGGFAGGALFGLVGLDLVESDVAALGLVDHGEIAGDGAEVAGLGLVEGKFAVVGGVGGGETLLHRAAGAARCAGGRRGGWGRGDGRGWRRCGWAGR